MRKLPLIIASFLIVAGGSYALIPTLFPDTPGLPRVPTGAGTIGSIIAKILGTTDLGNYIGDGKVTNSLALSGVAGSEYLKNTTCSGTDKWIGIDADGKALCGVSTPLLVDYGTISEEGCPANVYHANGTQGLTNTGDTLKSGDIIKTGACGLTIAFSDLSILRLDADTTVSLDVATTPAPASQTIASAILSNGSLWGRILTETGSYSIGTDKIVAGVRGTSVSVTSTGDTVGIFTYQTGTGWTFPITRSTTNQTELNVLDSTTGTAATPGSYAATVFCVDPSGKRYPSPGMIPGKKIRIPHTGCTATPNLGDEETKTSYIASSWIRRNTQKDIRYMYDTLVYSGMTIGSKKEKIYQELTLTQPPDEGDDEAKNICEAGQRWWTPRYGCQEISLYALADYTKPVPGPSVPQYNKDLLYFTGGIGHLMQRVFDSGNVPIVSNEGVEINENGEYLQYAPSTADLARIAGKKIEIELSASPPNIGLHTLLSLGIGYGVYKSGGSWYCSFGSTATPCGTNYNVSNNTFTYAFPGIPTWFLIGNSSTAPYNTPIGVNIKRILIK